MRSTFSALSDELTQNQNEIARLEGERARVNAKLDAELARVKGERAPLQAYYREVRSAFSPIRRMPSEILVAIFALCAKPSKELAKKGNFNGSLSVKTWTHVASLAEHPLLTVSRVCIRWHEIALGTPTLWATIDLDGSNMWDTQLKNTALELLRVALDRSAKASLKISPRAFSGMDTRYQVEDVGCGWRSAVTGSRTFQATGELRVVAQDPTRIPRAVACMPRTHALKFRLELDSDMFSADDVPGLGIPRTSSNITSLSSRALHEGRERHLQGPYTPPSSGSDLPVGKADCPYALVTPRIPQPLCTLLISHPSSAESLDLGHVLILEAELIESLATLPLLEQLTISDHDIVPKAHLLITDSLLSKLTLAGNSPPLIPDLRSLTCNSLLEFDDTVYLDFVLSRRHQVPGLAPFLNRMRWLPGRPSRRDRSVVARLNELCTQKQVFSEFSSANLWP
ncbi:hypothetical protein B0H17DRAFT_1284598 [Mycena rosella]|uniref:F-box domain-containing protein n=1 Tax=Mycena rosella TaxID=1033263 RepID=A0AAD7GKF6_MYCRO|nr:hypothetical protein B0H17DRAFT_1284598 [Mycena rosella]